MAKQIVTELFLGDSEGDSSLGNLSKVRDDPGATE